jgi:hypothetical protein
MARFVLSLLIALIMGFGLESGGAADLNEAMPTLTEDAVTGTIVKREGLHYWIKDKDGKETKLHVDDSTKLDKVVVGDLVKAYVTRNGETAAPQRAE